MSIPKNPDTIVIKNPFYPNGLKEIEIWNYYQKYKGIILNNTRGRDLMLAIMIELNTPILKRRKSLNEFIQLKNDNYDFIISGRTTAIYSTMKAYENFCVIDIDTDNWKKAVAVTSHMYDLMKKSNFITTIKILYTGKNSFHLHCGFINSLPINKIKTIVHEYIRQNVQHNLFTLLNKRTPDKPNIDLSPNKYKGAYITEGSLSIWGLKCMVIKLNNLNHFRQNDAKLF